MYRTRSEQVGRDFPFDAGDGSEERRKRRNLQLSSLGALVLDRIALGPDDLHDPCPAQCSAPDRHDLDETGVVVHSEFLVCGGGLCVPTNGPLRCEEHLGIHYIVGRSSWERCASGTHATARLSERIDELDPHDLASEAVALADPGVD